LVRHLLRLQQGDVLTFAHPLDRPLETLVNGTPKFKGRIVNTDGKIGLQIEDVL
jgi:flagellar motor switch/type III secretory pathway protein FliN